MLFRTAFAALILASTVATGCDLDSDRIGSDGGTIVSEDGRMSIEIPAGALDQEVEITIAVVAGPDGSASDLYVMEPMGLTFSRPVVVTYDYDDETLGDADADALTMVADREADWAYLGDLRVDEADQTVSASLNLDGSIRETASIPFAGGLAASTIRSLLGLGGVLTHSFKVTTVQSAAINQDKVLDFNRTEVTRRTQCHGNSDSTEPSVQTHVNLAIYSNPSSDEGIATAELWGTEVITIVGTPETACGVNTGTSTPGGGGPTGGPDPTPTQGGTGNTSVPPLPVPPPIGGPTREGLPLPPPKEGATKDQGRRSPDLRNPAYSVGSSHRVAAQANPVEDFRRSAWFGLLVEEKYAGHPCMPFYVRVAPDQLGVTFASMGTAYQTQVGREKVQIPIEPTAPIELTPGIWLLEFPFQGGDPGWVRFQASFDPTFPEGNTATNHAELLAQGFTLGEFRPGSHLEPRIEHRALIRAAGTLPEYAPLSRVCNSLDFTTLTMSWEQVSGGTVDWQSPPRIVLDPLFDQAAIIWKASVPPGPNAILHVTVSDGTVPITFELSLGHSGS